MDITTQAKIVKFLKHVGLLALYAAVSVALVALVGVLSHVDISTLPVAYQGVAVFALPIILDAIGRVQKEIQAAQDAENSAKQLAAVSAQLADAKAVIAHSVPADQTKDVDSTESASVSGAEGTLGNDNKGPVV